MNRWLNYVTRLQPYNIVKGVRYLRHFGPRQFWVRLTERMEPEEVPYGPWYEAYVPTEEELKTQRAAGVRLAEKGGPLLSVVVPVYRTPLPYLRDMLRSVRRQTYPNWELCIVNASPYDPASGRGDETDRKVAALLKKYAEHDSRIHVQDLTDNAGIAENTNAGIRMASGDWICLLDHDDLLSPAALYQVVRYAAAHPSVGMIYTDEDKIRERESDKKPEHLQPNLKPDFNLDLLRSNNYITHFTCVRRDVLPEGLMRSEFNGAQDYDFIFRCAENCSGRVGHVPEILYHWRIHAASTADNPISKQYAYEAGRRAIAEHLQRTGTPGSVTALKDFGFYRVSYPVQGQPLVSILIPNKDHASMLRKCIQLVREKSTYRNVEILVIENNSEESETFTLYKELEERGEARILYWDGPFNYAAINNFGAAAAAGEYLLLLNNDIEVITPDWIEQMLGVCQRPEVGACGVRLYYPDDTYQHAGIVIGIGGIAGSMFVDMKRGRGGYLHKAELLQDLSAVTAACMMLRREIFEEIGGFTEELAVAFNDVDLCLRIRQAGYLVVYNPYAEMYHLESKSRGVEDTKQKVRRFQTEIEYMRTRWEKLLKSGDPMYNKNLSLSKWNYSLKNKERMR